MPNEQRGEYIIFLLMPIMATSLVFAGRYAMVNGVEVEVLELGRKKSKFKKMFSVQRGFFISLYESSSRSGRKLPN
jgi:hypothetical protein